jgi:hypothetical protein
MRKKGQGLLDHSVEALSEVYLMRELVVQKKGEKGGTILQMGNQ